MAKLNQDCPVCLVSHDPGIHAATVRVHRWLLKSLAPDRRIMIPVQQAGREWGNKGKIRAGRCSG